MEYRFQFPQLTGTNGGPDLYIAGTNILGAIFRYVPGGNAPGLYLSGCQTEVAIIGCNAWGYYNGIPGSQCFEFPGTNQSELMAIPGIRAIDDWATIKVGISNGKYFVMCNGKLIFETPRPITNAPVWGYSQIAFLRARDYEVDWIKMYGDNDQLVYFEDFNTPATPATIDAQKTTCSQIDCKTDFTQYLILKEKPTTLTIK